MKRTIYYGILPLLLLLVLAQSTPAQVAPRYLVRLADKANSPYSIQNPTAFLSERALARRQRQNIAVTESDLPVNPAYLQALRQTGAKVLYSSRWFNAALVEATDAQLAAIRNLPFYRSIEHGLPLANLNAQPTRGLARLGAVSQKLGTLETIDHGQMRNQLALLGVPAFQETGYRGQGMLIAVFDAGFLRANQVGYLRHLYNDQKVLDTHDYIGRDGDVYNDHNHGLNVLSTIAANQPGSLVGAAFEASFALYRTENEYSESPYEEVTWLLAAERADSLGADIINTSLGYNVFEGEFDTPAYNYTYANMDGQTTIVSRAARWAARKGILVVCSAGNEGNDAWRYITAPADVDSVVSVGATYLDRSIAPFSSIGPTANGLLKPDVAAVGAGVVVGNQVGQGGISTSNGTSFSAPQIAGMAAILWQAYPFLTAQQVRDVLRKSGHQASRPDNFLGYGVPNLATAQQIIQAEYGPLGQPSNSTIPTLLYPNPTTDELLLSLGSFFPGERVEFRILHPSGTLVSTSLQTIGPTVVIPVRYLSAGLYLLRFTTTQGTYTLRFIKQ
ncbi:S8 family serine peptidase [Rhabdobacter roseus]|uniref:Subtilisin family serine protease n=1 Tax=Rhabdobacter roseus TaxID=1655419 RepID=A0A840TRG3_9BACT|nr:S8 family peptidase [Rhabdobacter roseus]MBB5286916.1 subtilisin family serine protease [Rhabdobacter roseus]